MNPSKTVGAERIVDCPLSFAIDRADGIFATLEASGGSVRVPYRAWGVPLPGAFAHRVAVTFRRQPDASEPGRVHDEIRFDWNAHSWWLPNLRGAVRFRVEWLKTRVALQGEYVPPFGTFGAVFDRLVGHHLAVATADDVVNRLASVLEARWAREKEA